MDKRLHLFWPLTLIAAGVLWILIAAGRIPAANLWALTYLWPVLLVGAGLGLILRPYWAYAGATLSALVVGILFLSVLYAGQLGWNRVPFNALDGSLFFVGPAERGSGHVITDNRSVQGFASVHMSYPANYIIRQGSTEGVTIEADDNVAASIQTRVSSGILAIDNGPDHRIFVSASRPVNITITVKDLRELNFDSAGQVTIQPLKTSALKVRLDGAGSMTFGDLQVGSLDAGLSGVGSMRASGTADSLDVAVDGLGSFNGEGLRAQKAVVALNGMGSANVWVDKTLDANVNGVGSVNYFGSAQVSKAVNGVGNVHYMGSK